MNDIVVRDGQVKTSIEIALGIDDNGMTTARKLFDFLQMHPKNYARWIERNITNNAFATEGEDYFPFLTSEERTNNGIQPNPTTDYRLTALFAKKLAMLSKTERGEQARDYFTRMERNLKAVALIPPTTAGQIQLLAQGQVDIQERMGKIEQDFASFREDLPLFPKELASIRKEVKTKAMDIVGGKDSPAYIYYRMVVRDIYAQIWRDFDVDSYADIRRADLPRVPDSISRYSPPLYLSDLIKNVA